MGEVTTKLLCSTVKIQKEKNANPLTKIGAWGSAHTGMPAPPATVRKNTKVAGLLTSFTPRRGGGLVERGERGGKIENGLHSSKKGSLKKRRG